MTWSLAAASLRDDEESRAFLQDRLAFLGKVGAAFFASVALLRTVLLVGHPQATEWGLVPINTVMVGLAAVYAVLWLSSRGRPRPIRVLRAADAASVVLAGLAVGGLALARVPFVVTVYPMVIAIAHVLLARAVIVPSTPDRSFAVSGAASLPVLAGILVHLRLEGRMVGLQGPGSADAGIQALWTLVSVGLSVLASRVIYGLRTEVREARKVGQYTLEEKLGEGGMGVVYRARHALLKRPTAVKLLLPEKAGQAAVERFEREVQLTARLSHPNTVSVFDYGHTLDGVFYYVMELLEGLSLESLVEADGPQPAGRVVHILQQATSALVEAHGLGIVHRDIKPANVFLCARGGVLDAVKVLDFGLVKDVANADALALTRSNTVLGTPLYMAPEAVTAPERVDARADLYALGAVGYFLLAGTPVFEGRNAVEVLGHHLHTSPVPPSERLGRPVPEDLEATLLACLEKDPGRRPPDAKTLLLALERARGVEPWTQDAARAWWEGRAAFSAARAWQTPGSTPRPPGTTARSSAASGSSGSRWGSG